VKSAAYGVLSLITSKVLDARRRGATRLNRMEQYAADDALPVIMVQKNSCQIGDAVLL
jgi:hypothetical protein